MLLLWKRLRRTMTSETSFKSYASVKTRFSAMDQHAVPFSVYQGHASMALRTAIAKSSNGVCSKYSSASKPRAHMKSVLGHGSNSCDI